jgi:hypothetical protein
MQSMKHWFSLVTALCSLASFAEAKPPPVFPFPEHPPVDPKNFTPYVRERLAKVRIGGTRQDVTSGFRPKGGTMLSPIETYYFEAPHSPGDGGDTLFIDIVFRPAGMSRAVFTKSRSQEDRLRRAGSWPVADPRDVIQAVSKPYRGPRACQKSGNESILEVSQLSTAARQGLQSLKVGMTRREVLRTFDPTWGLIRPPLEPYCLRNAHQENRPLPIVVEIAFKPAAMDQSTYDNPSLRAAWFRDHPWLPGDNLDDPVMDFQIPHGGESHPDEPVIDIHQLVEADRERLEKLKVGMTRKQLDEVFAGGTAQSNLRALYYLSDARTPHLLNHPNGVYLSIEVSFAPAGSNLTGRARLEYLLLEYIHHPHRFPDPESDDDVVTGFGRPFEFSQGLNWD